MRRLTWLTLSLAAALSLTCVWLYHRRPSVHLRIETTPPGCDVWMNGQHLGRSPLELDLVDQVVENNDPKKAPAPYCVVNVICGGKESVVELDTFLNQWKVGRLRFEAGKTDKQLVNTYGPAPVPKKTWLHGYQVTIPIWVN